MEIKQITEQNPWWIDPEKINEDSKVLESISKDFRIRYTFPEENLLIIGPRQVGKTTYLKLFVRDLIGRGVDARQILYFSCEML